MSSDGYEEVMCRVCGSTPDVKLVEVNYYCKRCCRRIDNSDDAE